MEDIIIKGKVTKFKIELSPTHSTQPRIELSVKGMEKRNLEGILFSGINHIIDVGQKITIYISPYIKINKELSDIKRAFAYRIILPSGSEIINREYKRDYS